MDHLETDSVLSSVSMQHHNNNGSKPMVIGGYNPSTATTVMGAPSLNLVPLQNQEREDAIRTHLKVLSRLQRGDKLHCGVGVEIEGRYGWPWQGIVRRFYGQSKDLTKEKISIILDDATQHIHTLLQHAQHTTDVNARRALMDRINAMCQDMDGAVSGIDNVIQTTYVNDVNFESQMRVKMNNVERTLTTINAFRESLGEQPVTIPSLAAYSPPRFASAASAHHPSFAAGVPTMPLQQHQPNNINSGASAVSTPTAATLTAPVMDMMNRLWHASTTSTTTTHQQQQHQQAPSNPIDIPKPSSDVPGTAASTNHNSFSTPQSNLFGPNGGIHLEDDPDASDNEGNYDDDEDSIGDE